MSCVVPSESRVDDERADKKEPESEATTRQPPTASTLFRTFVAITFRKMLELEPLNWTVDNWTLSLNSQVGSTHTLSAVSRETLQARLLIDVSVLFAYNNDPMTDRCSLAHELRDETAEEASADEELAVSENDIETHPRETAIGEGTVETISDIDGEVVLLDNDPLVQYLQDKQLPPPSHIVKAPTRPTSPLHNGDTSDDTSCERDAKPAHQWPVERCQQALHALLIVLCPCSFVLLPAGQTAEFHYAAVVRQRFHHQCQQQQQSSPHATAAPLPQRPLHALLHVLNASMWLHASCCFIASLILLITVGRALFATVYSNIELASYTVLLAFCSCNWTMAQVRHAVCAHISLTCLGSVNRSSTPLPCVAAVSQHNFRVVGCWQSSTSSLVSLSRLHASSSHLVHRSTRRICEVELVARGYLLSDNLASAIRLDQPQAHSRRSRHIRRTLQHMVSTAVHDNETAQLTLLAGQKQLCNTVRVPMEDDNAVLSIGELKERAEQLSRTQSITLSLLASISATPCQLLVAAVVDEQLARLVASTRQRCQLLENAMSMWQMHSHSEASLPLPTAEISADRVGSSLASLRQLSHQLRSAEARSSLACEQSQLDGSVSLISHIDYIQRAVHDVQRICDELAEQQATDNKPSAPSLPPVPSPTEQQRTTESEAEQSSLRSVLRRARRRQLADGQGAVFEGSGQWREKGSEGSEEGVEGEEQRLDRKQRMAEKKKSSTAQAGRVSQFVASLSMMRELKSVLSHRPAMQFASIQADGDGNAEMDDG